MYNDNSFCSHHPYGGGLIEWQVLKSYLMAHSLDIYGRADTASALDPLGRSLFADEKRQDKQ
jgi:hypothetical protein